MRKVVLLPLLLLSSSCAVPNEPVTLPANTPIGLHVSASVTPRVIPLGDSAAVIRLRIRAYNPSDSILRIVSGGPPYRFTPDPAESSGLRQSYRIASTASALHGGPGADYWGDSMYIFRAREESVVEVELPLTLWRQGGWPAMPGVYRIRAYFNGREGEAATFEFVP